MNKFEYELSSRVAASQRALEADGAMPLGGTSAMIRRKRAVRQGATAGIAVVAAALLFTTGTAALHQWRGDQPVAPNSPTPTTSSEIEAYVSLPADGPNPTVPISGIACGDPAPAAATQADGYQLDVVLDEPSADATAGGYLEGETRVTNATASIVSAYSLEPEVVVVRNGTVVAVNSSGGLGNRDAFREGHDLLVNEFNVGPWNACADDSDEHYLHPGKYEFYVVSTVANSPEIAALAQLSDIEGVDVAFPEDPWLEPTDAECSGDPSMGGIAPVDVICLPAIDPHIMWTAARSVVVPYRDEAAGRVFSTQLVAGPFDYEVADDALEFPPEPEFVGVACGVEVPWDEDANSVTVTSPDLADLWGAGGGSGEALVSPTFGPHGVQARSTQVLVPKSGQGAIIQQSDVVNDDGVTTDVQYRVIGHALVTVNGGEALDVRRAAAPARVPLDIADVTWCAGEAPPALAAGQFSMTMYPDQLVGGQEDTPKLRFYPVG